MKLQDVFKISESAVGAIKCTYAVIYILAKGGAQKYAPLYSLRKDWLRSNDSGYYLISSDLLAEYASAFPGERIFAGKEYDANNSIVDMYILSCCTALKSDHEAHSKFTKVYLDENAITAVDKAITTQIATFERRINKWLERTTGKAISDITSARRAELMAKAPSNIQDWQYEKSRYKDIIELLKEQYEAGTPFYVQTSALDWFPNFRDEAGNNPYVAAFEQALSEVDRLQTLILAAGAASLI